jgi:hypothetical protein
MRNPAQEKSHVGQLGGGARGWHVGVPPQLGNNQVVVGGSNRIKSDPALQGLVSLLHHQAGMANARLLPAHLT